MLPARRLAAAHEVDDLQRVALADDHLGEPLSLEDGEVVLDRHAAWIDVQLREQIGDRDRLLDLERFAVEGDVHGTVAAYRAGAGQSSDRVRGKLLIPHRFTQR